MCLHCYQKTFKVFTFTSVHVVIVTATAELHIHDDMVGRQTLSQQS